MSVKVSRLTPANIRALRDIGAEDHGVQIAETYAVFTGSAADALAWVQHEMLELDNRTGHPYASLHAVVRKLSAQANDDSSPATHSASGEFRPQPGEFFQVWKGLGHDDTMFRVIEYAPMTAAPERIQKLYNMPMLPTEAVHAWRLEKVPLKRGGKGTEWAGVAFIAFPVEVMVEPGVVVQSTAEGPVVLALTAAQTAERVAEIDADYRLQLAELIEEHGVVDALDLPRDVFHKLERWRSDSVALAYGRDPQSREFVGTATGTAVRGRRRGGGRSRPTSGRCEHCGEPTKGGRFVPGHDAKLKGDLGREAQSNDPAIRIPALVESRLRSMDSQKWYIEPADEDAAEIDQLVLKDGWLESRIAARIAKKEG
jgi:hypothetical protein